MIFPAAVPPSAAPIASYASAASRNAMRLKQRSPSSATTTRRPCRVRRNWWSPNGSTTASGTNKPSLYRNLSIDQHPGKLVLVVIQMDDPAAGDRRELARDRVVGRPLELDRADEVPA